MKFDPQVCLDFYKTGHHLQYPEGTKVIVSNATPRSSRIPGVSHHIFFGLQYYIQEFLVRRFRDQFFNIDIKKALNQYREVLREGLGVETEIKESDPNIGHLVKLHKLGRLPLTIRALPEGSAVPLRVPEYTIENTHPDFYWLPNFLETQMSAELWGMCNSATIANMYKKTFLQYAKLTGCSEEFTNWQGHDFSMRGMWGCEAAAKSGAGHLLSFTGTDTIPAILFLREYYKNGPSDTSIIGGSVPATEHAVMCAGGAKTQDEKETILRLLTQIYPSGILSVVSDSWDYWKVITKTLPEIKPTIMARNGKLVVRPDSGDPFKILCGDDYALTPYERAGTIQCLWQTFGGTINAKGYKELDPHIGAIYGDSITHELQKRVLHKLASLGFASSNVVLGIGSFTYQHATRDTFGYAIKATYSEIGNEKFALFKKPKTDNGIKNSTKGLPLVIRNNDEYELIENVPYERFSSHENELALEYIDGRLAGAPTYLSTIRARMERRLQKELSHDSGQASTQISKV